MTDTDALRILRREFAARGWTRLPTARSLAELAANVAVALGGIAIFLYCDNIALKALGMFLSTCGSMGVGANTHTSSHYATTKFRGLNEALTYFGFPFFLGLPATYWWHDHVSVHHVSHNVFGVDDDFNLAPWFAVTAPQVAESKGLQRLYYTRLQIFFLPFALLGSSFLLQVVAWRYLIACILSKQERSAKHFLDVLSLILHYAIWIGLPCLFFPLTHVLAFYALRIGLMGYALFFVLGPGHFPAEALLIEKRPAARDYLRFQTETCVNFKTNFIGRLICGGLEYHIEHHLFPDINHAFYPQVSVLLKSYCVENGLQYRVFSWPVVMWKVIGVFRKPKALVPGTGLDGPAPERSMAGTV